MGWISWTSGQLLMSATVLGTLKRHGVIVLKPETIKNETVRSTVVQAASDAVFSPELPGFSLLSKVLHEKASSQLHTGVLVTCMGVAADQPRREHQ
jgi:hypothetical protein